MSNCIILWTFVATFTILSNNFSSSAEVFSFNFNSRSPRQLSNNNHPLNIYNNEETFSPSKRVPRFSFFREYIEPLAGVLNDIFPSFSQNDPIVETTNGLLRGTIKESRDGRPYYAFVGVPYSKPPIGQLRFEPPQKLTTRWEGIRDAINYQPACFHMDTFVTGRFRGQEDCLYANIYTPKYAQELKQNLPVMVYLHGGGYTSGSGDFYQGKYFMDEDVVLVVFNYRLSALGFLNTGEEIRGNMALKDQNMLLQYLKSNIQFFGGDPSRITLFGESAGASMTQFHILSPLSKGLFHRAIVLSGSSLSPWAFSYTPIANAKRFAKYAQCPTRNETLMVKCLKSASLHDLTKEYAKMMDPITNPADFYAPSIETVITSDTMIYEHPEKTLKKGTFNKVPLIQGVNSMEGFIYTSRIVADRFTKKNMNKRWNKWIPELLSYDPQNTTTSKMLKSLYFPSEKVDLFKTEDLIRLTHLLSDGTFLFPSHKFAELYKKHAPTYLYYNSYQGRMSVFDILSKVSTRISSSNGIDRSVNTFPELTLGTGIFSDLMRYSLTNEKPSSFGASHGDITFLLFNMRRTPGIGRLSMDYEMSKTFVKALTDFASADDEVFYNGIPWPKLKTKGSSMKYMSIELPGSIIEEPFAERMQVWNDKFPIN